MGIYRGRRRDKDTEEDIFLSPSSDVSYIKCPASDRHASLTGIRWRSDMWHGMGALRHHRSRIGILGARAPLTFGLVKFQLGGSLPISGVIESDRVDVYVTRPTYGYAVSCNWFGS
ncbi:hypothetical protein L3X38_006078 [Prunus dulcis]|uniref:Uncharacterized protein n=1 Tax=Prunus dulcis TaxID=3755 RepID=A0AAD4ZS03_PRUDU|nr:hypothetical protein L3X38_006078 [Prunus dulcis]